MSNKDDVTITHYKSDGRYGKRLVEEEVKDGSDTALFLERMEMRRLSTPCNIAINMSGKVPGKCQDYEFAGIIHKLDDKSIENFENEAAKYEGKYTVGVFEKVMSSDHTFKAQHEKEVKLKLAERDNQEKKRAISKDSILSEEAEESQSPNQKASHNRPEHRGSDIQLIPFGYRVQRKENRLTYTTGIDIKLPDNKELKGKTNDISVAGIKVHLLVNLEGLKNGSEIKIKFTQLEEKYRRNFGYIKYNLIAHETDEQNQFHMRLTRDDPSSNESFNKFIIEFISSYYSRYKIDLEDNLLSLKAKAYERIYTSSAPLVVNLLSVTSTKTENLYTAARHAELTQTHQVLYGAIAKSLTQQIVKSNLEQLNNNPYLLIETFVIKANNSFEVYCASRQKLIEEDIFDDYLKVGGQSYYIARVQVTVQRVNSNDCDATLMYLDSLNEIDSVAAQSISESWQSISHIAYVSLIEEKQSPGNGLANNHPSLEPFKAYKLAETQQRIWSLSYRNERKDTRYLHKSSVVVDVDKQSFSGNMIDFSPSGLRIELENIDQLPASLNVGKNITINLPELQKLAKKTANLSTLSYRVTQCHPHQKAISLKRDFTKSKHDGEKFFSRLIENNQSKLSECTEDTELTVISEMLEALIGLYLPGIPLFIDRFPGRRLAIHSAAATENANPLLWRFKDDNSFYFKPLNLEESFSEVIKPHQNRKGQFTKKQTLRLFAVFPPSENNESNTPADSTTQTTIMSDKELKNSRDIAQFILKTRREDNHRIFRAHFLPPPYVKLEEFSEELKIIRKNSPNKAKELEKNLLDMVAILDIEDITAFYSS